MTTIVAAAVAARDVVRIPDRYVYGAEVHTAHATPTGHVTLTFRNGWGQYRQVTLDPHDAVTLVERPEPVTAAPALTR